MAWNEPGGNKGSNRNGQKDPWQRNHNEQGPPDLDEFFKKIFGGGGKGSGGASLPGKGILLAIFAAFLIIYGYMGIYTVDEQENALVLRLGKYQETLTSGLHWYFPGLEQIKIENVTRLRELTERSSMLTEDDNIVNVRLSVQYFIGDLESFILNVKDPELSLKHATESAVRHVVGGSEMHSVLTEGRELLASDVKDRIQSYMDGYGTGLIVTKVNIEDTSPPTEVQESFDDVIRAQEDLEREKNRAQTYANGVIPEARGHAQRLLEEANGYKARIISSAEGETQRFTQLLGEYTKAPEVTRQRLYLDAVEQVMGSTTKIMVGAEGGNNLLYLPLDKLMEKSGAGNQVSPSSVTNYRGDDSSSNRARAGRERDDSGFRQSFELPGRDSQRESR